MRPAGGFLLIQLSNARGMETATKGRKRTAMPEKEERGMLSRL